MRDLREHELEAFRDIYSCVRSGNLEKLNRLFVEHPQLATYPNDRGKTWLHEAARHGSVAMLRYFLDSGLDVNALEGNEQDTPLDKAIRKAHLDAARFLLEQGANPKLSRPMISAINIEDEATALEFVKLLVDFGADVNQVYPWFNSDAISFTPLEYAGEKQEILAYLRSVGAVERTDAATPADPRSHSQDVVEHLETQYGPRRPMSLREIVPTDIPLEIHAIPPNDRHHRLTLFTTGMSAHAMKVPDGQTDHQYAELLIHLPANWPLGEESLATDVFGWPISWLRNIARYPHEQASWLGGPFTIVANGNPPEPLATNTELSSLMLAATNEVVCHDGKLIQTVIWLLAYVAPLQIHAVANVITMMVLLP